MDTYDIEVIHQNTVLQHLVFLLLGHKIKQRLITNTQTNEVEASLTTQ